METLTKKELQKRLVDKVDELFTLTDWEAFKSMLQDLIEQATSVNYRYSSWPQVCIQLHSNEIRLLQDMSYKFLLGQKVATKKRTRDLKHDLAWSLNYSDLPGDAYSDDEFSTLIRYR